MNLLFKEQEQEQEQKSDNSTGSFSGSLGASTEKNNTSNPYGTSPVDKNKVTKKHGDTWTNKEEVKEEKKEKKVKKNVV
jgi:hypothetical protein